MIALAPRTVPCIPVREEKANLHNDATPNGDIQPAIQTLGGINNVGAAQD